MMKENITIKRFSKKRIKWDSVVIQGVSVLWEVGLAENNVCCSKIRTENRITYRKKKASAENTSLQAVHPPLLISRLTSTNDV